MAPGPQQPPHQPTNQHNRNARAVNRQNSAPGTVPGVGVAREERDLVPTAPSSSRGNLARHGQTPRKSRIFVFFVHQSQTLQRVLFLLNRKQTLFSDVFRGCGALITRQLTEDFSYPDGGSQQASRLLRGLALPSQGTAHRILAHT